MAPGPKSSNQSHAGTRSPPSLIPARGEPGGGQDIGSTNRPSNDKSFSTVMPVRGTSRIFRREADVAIALPQLPPPVIVETDAWPTSKVVEIEEDVPLKATLRAMVNWLLLLLLLVLAARGIYEYREWHQKRMAERAKDLSQPPAQTDYQPSQN